MKRKSPPRKGRKIQPAPPRERGERPQREARAEQVDLLRVPARPPLAVSGQNLAARVGVTKQRISQLAADGVLVRGADGRFNLAENLRRWEEHEGRKQSGRKLSEAGAALNTQLIFQKVRKARIQADQLERILIPRTEVQREFARAFHAVRVKIQALQNELPPLLDAQPLSDKQKIVGDRVAKILAQLAESPWHDPRQAAIQELLARMSDSKLEQARQALERIIANT
jgi:hypothetical protein